MQCNELLSSLSLPEICSNHKLIYVLKTPEIWLHTQKESKRETNSPRSCSLEPFVDHQYSR